MITNTYTLSNIATALSTAGLSLPQEAAKHATLVDHLASLVEPPAQDIDDMTVENAAEVIERQTRYQVDRATRQSIVGDMRERAAGRALSSVRAAVDEVVKSLRPEFEKQAAVVAKHAAAYEPDEATDSVLNRGAQAAAAWRAIRDASARLDVLLAAVTAVRDQRTPGVHLLDAVAVSYDGDWWKRSDASDLFTGPARWHAVVAFGIKLRLNTSAEVKALLEATPPRELRAELDTSRGFVSRRMVRG